MLSRANIIKSIRAAPSSSDQSISRNGTHRCQAVASSEMSQKSHAARNIHIVTQSGVRRVLVVEQAVGHSTKYLCAGDARMLA